MITLAVGSFVTREWMPNGKYPLVTEYLMTPILCDDALIVGQGKLESSNPIRVQRMVRANHSDPALEYRRLHVR